MNLSSNIFIAPHTIQLVYMFCNPIDMSASKESTLLVRVFIPEINAQVSTMKC